MDPFWGSCGGGYRARRPPRSISGYSGYWDPGPDLGMTQNRYFTSSYRILIGSYRPNELGGYPQTTGLRPWIHGSGPLREVISRARIHPFGVLWGGIHRVTLHGPGPHRVQGPYKAIWVPGSCYASPDSPPGGTLQGPSQGHPRRTPFGTPK